MPGSGSQEQLSAEGVPGVFVWTHGENRSSLSVADRETGGLTEFYEHGSVVPGAAWAELTHACAVAVRPGPVAHDQRLAPARRAGRGLPRPRRRGADGGAPGRGRLRRGPAAARARGGARHRQGERDRGARAAGRSDGAARRVAHRRPEAARPGGWRRPRGGGDAGRRGGRAGGAGRHAVRRDAVRARSVPGRERRRVPGGARHGARCAAMGWDDALCRALGAATANAEIPGAARLDPARAADLGSQAQVRIL